MRPVRNAFVLALVAGCGFQVTPGSIVQDGGPPDDNPSTDGMVDAPLDAPIDTTVPFADQDGDAIADSSDNCLAIANTDQRNHDSDPFGDACDRCPHLASTTDPDGDGDGVGDACDPRPSLAGDQRVLWAGFYDANDITGWSGLGTFTVVGGYLQPAGTNTSGFGPPSAVNVPFVMSEVVLDQPTANGSVGVAVTTPTNSQFECSLARTGSNVALRARRLGGDNDSTTWTGTFAAGDRVTFRLDLANNVGCRGVQGGIDQAETAFTNDDPTGRAFLGAEGITVRFDYMFVVDEAP
jgi:hypothetical protein